MVLNLYRYSFLDSLRIWTSKCVQNGVEDAHSYLFNFFSNSATANVVFTTESGFKDMDSIPHSTRNFANSILSLGACPQKPMCFFILFATWTTRWTRSLTASLLSL